MLRTLQRVGSGRESGVCRCAQYGVCILWQGSDTRDTEGELGAAHTWMLEISCALLTPSSAAVELKEWSAWAPRWRVC